METIEMYKQEDVWVLTETMLDTENDNCVIINNFGVFKNLDVALESLERAVVAFVSMGYADNKVKEMVEKARRRDGMEYYFKLDDGSVFIWKISHDVFYHGQR